MTARDADVVVVGAGLAGLTAARELSGTGLEVVVLEARERIGGRTWTKRDALAGIDLDMGAMSVDGRQPLVTGELARRGIGTGAEAPFAPPTRWLLGDRLLENGLPVPAAQLGELERLLAALHAAGAGIDRDAPVDARQIAELDVAITAWVERLRLAPATHELACVFGSSLVSGEAAESSMLLLARQFAAAGGVWPFLSVDYADIDGGTASLVAAIAGESSADVRLGVEVAAVEHAPDGVVVHAAGGEAISAAVAVLTPPVNALRRIRLAPELPPATAAGLAAGTANVGAKYWALARNAPDDLHALGAVPGIDVASTWKQVPGGALVVAFGRDARALDGDDRDAVQAALRHYVPDLEVEAVAWHDWTSDPLTGGTWGGWRPGFARDVLPVLQRGTGRLLFAGSETATRWPGFMEGAIESGLRAAGQALEVVGPGAGAAAAGAR